MYKSASLKHLHDHFFYFKAAIFWRIIEEIPVLSFCPGSLEIIVYEPWPFPPLLPSFLPLSFFFPFSFPLILWGVNQITCTFARSFTSPSSRFCKSIPALAGKELRSVLKGFLKRRRIYRGRFYGFCFVWNGGEGELHSPLSNGGLLIHWDAINSIIAFRRREGNVC